MMEVDLLEAIQWNEVKPLRLVYSTAKKERRWTSRANA